MLYPIHVVRPPGMKWSLDKQAIAAGPVETICTLLATFPSNPRMLAALADTMAMNQNILVSSYGNFDIDFGPHSKKIILKSLLSAD